MAEHRVHDAEDAANGHHDRHETDGIEKLPACLRHACVICGFDLGLNVGLLVVVPEELSESDGAGPLRCGARALV